MVQSRFLEPSDYWTSQSDSNQTLFLLDFFLLLSVLLSPTNLRFPSRFEIGFLNAAKARFVCRQNENNISGTSDVH